MTVQQHVTVPLIKPKKNIKSKKLISQITPNVQNINIVQHINIIQNGPNSSTFTNISLNNEPKNQEATPLKTGKNTISESITKKKKGDKQTKLQATPNKKGAKTQKSQKTEIKKKEKNQSLIIKEEIIIQDNEKPIEKGGYWGTDGLLKKRGRKKKDEVNEEVIDVIESSSFENKENFKSQQENSEFKRETRSKKIKY